jgi:hypothetical protein
MGYQIGVVSMAQLQLHDHYNLNTGGLINTVVRVADWLTKIDHPANSQTGSLTYVKLKSVLILEASPGTMNSTFELTRTGAAGNARALVRVYRLGALIWSGDEGITAAGPLTCPDLAIPVDLLYGDLVEIWGRVTAAGALCNVFAWEMGWTGYISHLSRRHLLTSLTLADDADFLYVLVM